MLRVRNLPAAMGSITRVTTPNSVLTRSGFCAKGCGLVYPQLRVGYPYLVFRIRPLRHENLKIFACGAEKYEFSLP